MYKTDNKKWRANIKNLEKRLDFQKYNIKEQKQEKSRKNYKIYMKFALKNRVSLFFAK